MTVVGSALYLGQVRHRRLHDREHRFTTRMWHVLIDLDEIPALARRIPFFSHNRFNLCGFDDRDHMGPERRPVRAKLEDRLRAVGAAPPSGRILLLTGLRHLGWAFDPVSFYYCYDQEGGLRWVIAEVDSTFGETIAYLLEVSDSGATRVVRQHHPKLLHVSPFQPTTGEYRFRITTPGDRLTVHIDLIRDGERVFDATLSHRRVPLTTLSLLRTLIRHPHQTATTLALIHLQAARLWFKKAPFHPKPSPPEAAWRTRHG